MSEQEKIRDFAREMYAQTMQGYAGEMDDWFSYSADVDVNIFQWENEKPRANVYRVVDGNTDTRDLIDDFEV